MGDALALDYTKRGNRANIQWRYLGSVYESLGNYCALVPDPAFGCIRHAPLAPLAILPPLAIQPAHSAYRHDAGSRGARCGRVVGTSMKAFLRYLRIAFSATCLVACVLLIALWIRSYFRVDTLERKTKSGLITIRTVLGELSYSQFSHPSRAVALDVQNAISQHGTFDSYSVNEWHSKEATGHLGFGWRQVTKYQTELIIPLWFPALITGVVAGLPWIGKARRFSLRTLLIATTLVAVVLGLIVYVSRQ